MGGKPGISQRCSCMGDWCRIVIFLSLCHVNITLILILSFKSPTGEKTRPMFCLSILDLFWLRPNTGLQRISCRTSQSTPSTSMILPLFFTPATFESDKCVATFFYLEFSCYLLLGTDCIHCTWTIDLNKKLDRMAESSEQLKTQAWNCTFIYLVFCKDRIATYKVTLTVVVVDTHLTSY